MPKIEHDQINIIYLIGWQGNAPDKMLNNKSFLQTLKLVIYIYVYIKLYFHGSTEGEF